MTIVKMYINIIDFNQEKKSGVEMAGGGGQVGKRRHM